MKKDYIYILLTSLTIAGCASKVNIDLSRLNEMPPWKASEEATYLYNEADNRKERIAVAKKGIESANRCASSFPEKAACYYYRAINTGLYYQSKVVGYQEGLDQMLTDAKKALSIDEGFEYGGPYRFLALLYAKAPSISLQPDAVLKDTDLALKYAQKAVTVSPGFPENHIVLAKVRLERNEERKAAKGLLKSKELMPGWKEYRDFPFWQKDIKELSKKLDDEIKDLQSASRKDMSS